MYALDSVYIDVNHVLFMCSKVTVGANDEALADGH